MTGDESFYDDLSAVLNQCSFYLSDMGGMRCIRLNGQGMSVQIQCSCRTYFQGIQYSEISDKGFGIASGNFQNIILIGIGCSGCCCKGRDGLSDGAVEINGTTGYGVSI